MLRRWEVVWEGVRAKRALSRGLECYWFSQQIRQSGCGHSSRRLARASGIGPNQGLPAFLIDVRMGEV